MSPFVSIQLIEFKVKETEGKYKFRDTKDKRNFLR